MSSNLPPPSAVSSLQAGLPVAKRARVSGVDPDDEAQDSPTSMWELASFTHLFQLADSLLFEPEEDDESEAVAVLVKEDVSASELEQLEGPEFEEYFGMTKAAYLAKPPFQKPKIKKGIIFIKRE